jgi:hypothetical protein
MDKNQIEIIIQQRKEYEKLKLIEEQTKRDNEIRNKEMQRVERMKQKEIEKTQLRSFQYKDKNNSTVSYSKQNGLLQGIHRVVSEDGNHIYEVKYIDGMREGLSTIRDLSGVAQIEYHANHPIGLYKKTYVDESIYVREYVNGEFVSTKPGIWLDKDGTCYRGKKSRRTFKMWNYIKFYWSLCDPHEWRSGRRNNCCDDCCVFLGLMMVFSFSLLATVLAILATPFTYIVDHVSRKRAIMNETKDEDEEDFTI